MFRAALLSIVLAACGGKAKPAEPTEPLPGPTTMAQQGPAEEAPPAGPADDALAQAALAEQYDTGKKLFVDKKCASCHGDRGEGNPKNPALIGEGALPEAAPAAAMKRKGVTFRTAKDVMDFVKTMMPPKAPGTLTDDEVAAVVAWVLSENKVAISAPLDASNAASIKLR